MSAELLDRLQAAHVFVPYPGWADLGRLHVEFDLLARVHVPYGQLQADQVESRLARNLSRGAVVGVVGERGGGKTSIASYVCGPMTENLAPFRIPLRSEDDRVATPRGFVTHTIKLVAQAAHETNLLSRRQRDDAYTALAGRRDLGRRLQLTGGARVAPAWLLGSSVELSGELAQATPQPGDYELSTTELLDRLHTMLAVVQRHGLMPVLVVDESDKWTDPVLAPTATGFFTEIPRLFSELLAPCSVRSCGSCLDLDRSLLP